MLLSLSINDLVTAVVSGISFGFMLLLVRHTIHVNYIAPWYSIIDEGFFGAGLIGDAVILVAIGLNRFVAYVFPFEMRPVHTKWAICLQWVYAISFGLTSIHPDIHTKYSVNESMGLLLATTPDTTKYHIKSLVYVITNLIAGLALTIVYSICVGKLIYYKLTIDAGQGTSTYGSFWDWLQNGLELDVAINFPILFGMALLSGYGSTSLAQEARLSFQGCFLSASLLLGSFLFGYAAMKGFAVSAAFLGFSFVVAVSNFVFGPFIIIGMSGLMRKHIRKLFKPNDNVVHVLPAANTQANRNDESKF